MHGKAAAQVPFLKKGATYKSGDWPERSFETAEGCLRNGRCLSAPFRTVFLCHLFTPCAVGAEDNMQKILFSSLLLTSIGTPLSTHAASNNDTIDLPETVVTATRSETNRSELAAATTIFTRNDIEKLQIRT